MIFCHGYKKTDENQKKLSKDTVVLTTPRMPPRPPPVHRSILSALVIKRLEGIIRAGISFAILRQPNPSRGTCIRWSLLSNGSLLLGHTVTQKKVLTEDAISVIRSV